MDKNFSEGKENLVGRLATHRDLSLGWNCFAGGCTDFCVEEGGRSHSYDATLPRITKFSTTSFEAATVFLEEGDCHRTLGLGERTQ